MWYGVEVDQIRSASKVTVWLVRVKNRDAIRLHTTTT